MVLFKRLPSLYLSYQVRLKSFKSSLDYSRVPKLDENDLEENFVKGSGPGGQAVNKTNNAVVLKHIPTGLVVKCHQTRDQKKNRTLARDLLITKLDNLMNGELSIENQLKTLKMKHEKDTDRKRSKKRALKEAFKKRECTDKSDSCE
ncbi:probable peptide chain release factor C12orf65, mitochondrial [Chelonus insularis]|uniref:probable peptide chain release factor C12orf65, mitochondrial n=1 Tax=Chelonus insularis TaxID=460826 RepID=UPI00158D7DB6|nr:probable peptide chain release factor C12orf65, mitochondrial [Chelonus insularis]